MESVGVVIFVSLVESSACPGTSVHLNKLESRSRLTNQLLKVKYAYDKGLLKLI